MWKQMFQGCWFRKSDKTHANEGEHPMGKNTSGYVSPNPCQVTLDPHHDDSTVWLRIDQINDNSWPYVIDGEVEPAILELDGDTAIIIGEAMIRFGKSVNTKVCYH